jgi:hypothetical protein
MLLKKLFLTLFLSTFLFASQQQFHQLIHQNGIDINSKSLKSWIRIFNSEEKSKAHGYHLTPTERFILLRGLKRKQKASKKRYSRGLR